jgi:hypothetical protein
MRVLKRLIFAVKLICIAVGIGWTLPASANELVPSIDRWSLYLDGSYDSLTLDPLFKDVAENAAQRINQIEAYIKTNPNNPRGILVCLLLVQKSEDSIFLRVYATLFDEWGRGTVSNQTLNMLLAQPVSEINRFALMHAHPEAARMLKQTADRISMQTADKISAQATDAEGLLKSIGRLRYGVTRTKAFVSFYWAYHDQPSSFLLEPSTIKSGSVLRRVLELFIVYPLSLVLVALGLLALCTYLLVKGMRRRKLGLRRIAALEHQ